MELLNKASENLTENKFAPPLTRSFKTFDVTKADLVDVLYAKSKTQYRKK